MDLPKNAQSNPELEPKHPGFLEALRVWFKIGLLSFGGPTGQIGLMHREVVERRRWVSDNRFLHALNYCMLLPGPEAQQLAIYLGWLLHRVRGGIAAGLMFVLPGAFLMWLISVIYVTYGDVPLVNAVFYGLKPAVIAIVVAALLRIGKKALKNHVMWTVSLLAFVGIFFFSIPFPVIILGAGLIGWAGGMRWPKYFNISGSHGNAQASGESGFVISDAISDKIGKPSAGRSLRSALFWAAVWIAPVLLCLIVLGGSHVLTQEGFFFSKASLVTFGGAYAVLPYVAQQAVETHGWLTATQMMDGLGLAETTPGPLVLVLQFVGFLGGFNSAGDMSPILMATLGAAMTSWVTFVPGFLFIFVGGPYVENSRGNISLNTALSAVTAAVVGVILNLAVWFAWHVVLPESGQPDYFSIAAIILFFIALQKLKWDILWVIGLGAVSGIVWHMTIGL